MFADLFRYFPVFLCKLRLKVFSEIYRHFPVSHSRDPTSISRAASCLIIISGASCTDRMAIIHAAVYSSVSSLSCGGYLQV